MKLFNRVAGAALAAALVAFTAAPAFANEGEVTPSPEGSNLRPYNSGSVEDGYRIFVTSEAPASTTDVADDGYGSQGFHHGLPETSLVPGTEPVAGGTDGM